MAAIARRMGGVEAERIEQVADRLAAAVFAAAVAYAFLVLLGGAYRQPQLAIFTAAAAATTFVVSARVLGGLAPEERRFALPEFEPRELGEFPAVEPPSSRFDEFCIVAGAADDELLLTEEVELLLTEAAELLLTEQVELILTDADRLGPPRVQLALDEILAELGPESRVVRLFDPAAMPTPGELNSRIERRLDDGSPAAPPNDDSQALFDALAELRRSLG